TRQQVQCKVRVHKFGIEKVGQVGGGRVWWLSEAYVPKKIDSVRAKIISGDPIDSGQKMFNNKFALKINIFKMIAQKDEALVQNGELNAVDHLILNHLINVFVHASKIFQQSPRTIVGELDK